MRGIKSGIRATPGLPSLRSARVFGALRRAIARASVDRFRVIHFSIQQDHGHFIVEADEARRARGGVHGLAIRLALAVNRALGRRGNVVGDRYHARPLRTPRHMRASMVAGGPLRVEEHPAAAPRPTRLDSADVAPTQTNTNSNTLWLTTSPTRARR
jgi:hypothetical protein